MRSTRTPLLRRPSGQLARALATASALLGCWSILMPGLARADYQLSPGDVLEVSVVGVPELKQRGTVGANGEVSLVLVGPVKVAGLPLAAARDRIVEALSSQIFIQLGQDGRERRIIPQRNTISVDVAEYRPVYVDGDVSKPGQHAYHPGMTVRQAIALSGGYDTMRFRAVNPILESSDLRSEHKSLLTDIVRLQARSARIQAEIDGKQTVQFSRSGLPAQIDPTVLAAIERLEAEQLKTSVEAFNQEREFRIRLGEQAQQQLNNILRRQEQLERMMPQQMNDYARLRESHEKGLVPVSRLLDEQRALQQISDQVLQISTQTGEGKRRRDEIIRDQQKLLADRRTGLAKELQDATVSLASAQARLQAASEKMSYTGALKSQLAGGPSRRPLITLFRKGNGAAERLDAEEGSELLPGDVIEVTLQSAIATVN